MNSMNGGNAPDEEQEQEQCHVGYCMNAFQTVGQIVARDRKGRSILVTLRYGRPNKPLKDESMQFVEFVRVRVPERVHEHCGADVMEIGTVVAIQGWIQGVLHREPAMESAALVMELVAQRVSHAQITLESVDVASQLAATKGQGRYVEAVFEHSGASVSGPPAIAAQ